MRCSSTTLKPTRSSASSQDSTARQRRAEAAKAAEAILNDPDKSLAYLTTPTEGSTRLKQMQMEINNPVYRKIANKAAHQPTLFRGMVAASGGNVGRAC